MPVKHLYPLLLVSVLAGGPAFATDDDTPPDAELLEFLGEFMTEDGTWVDPLDLDVANAPRDTENEEAQ